ncbi:MAG: hypothetical protein CL864_05675 [Cyanobium sp. SAT1300]|nr:hypothetical protein [Cyanobium sp. SAT1300]
MISWSHQLRLIDPSPSQPPPLHSFSTGLLLGPPSQQRSVETGSFESHFLTFERGVDSDLRYSAIGGAGTL